MVSPSGLITAPVCTPSSVTRSAVPPTVSPHVSEPSTAGPSPCAEVGSCPVKTPISDPAAGQACRPSTGDPGASTGCEHAASTPTTSSPVAAAAAPGRAGLREENTGPPHRAKRDERVHGKRDRPAAEDALLRDRNSPCPYCWALHVTGRRAAS